MVNYALKDAAFAAYVLFYYKQVLGLSGTLTGLAIALSVVWDAVSDPLVGAWSDKLHSRWGRRHPPMIGSVIPLALCFIALFSPPAVATTSQSGLFFWLLGSVILLRTALTFFVVPLYALGAEISTDYHERTRLVSARTNLAWFSGVIASASAMYFLFGGSTGEDGRFTIENYHHYGWVNAALVLLFSLTCILGTWHYIPRLVATTSTHTRGMLSDILGTFRNRNFRLVFLLETALGGLNGVVAALLMVTFTYFWVLDTTQISILFGGPPLVAIAVVVASAGWVNHRLEKHQLLAFSCALGAINMLWLTPLILLGIMPADAGIAFTLVFINYSIWVGTSIQRTIAAHALLADITDEYELETGQRQEGVMFAAAFFANKFITGFGYLVAGPFLDLIGLEAGTPPGEAPDSVILGLGLIMGPGLAILLAIPLLLTFRLRLSRERLAQVQHALGERRLRDSN
jgi:Na+/melibiose symporter-like transporter